VHRGGALAVGVSNIGRAVPTFAVLVVLVLLPDPFGLSTLSILTALVLFALPPILTNTYIGIREVDPAAVDAARGMGMSGPQVLAKVELPIATSLLMGGVRLASVQVIATATIAALVAGGGLGTIITHGFGIQYQAEVVAGALCVLVLALSVEGGMALLQKRLDPLRVVQSR
jgi:osmoprotectant transport system permease protein